MPSTGPAQDLASILSIAVLEPQAAASVFHFHAANVHFLYHRLTAFESSQTISKPTSLAG